MKGSPAAGLGRGRGPPFRCPVPQVLRWHRQVCRCGRVRGRHRPGVSSRAARAGCWSGAVCGAGEAGGQPPPPLPQLERSRAARGWHGPASSCYLMLPPALFQERRPLTARNPAAGQRRGELPAPPAARDRAGPPREAGRGEQCASPLCARSGVQSWGGRLDGVSVGPGGLYGRGSLGSIFPASHRSSPSQEAWCAGLAGDRFLLAGVLPKPTALPGGSTCVIPGQLPGHVGMFVLRRTAGWERAVYRHRSSDRLPQTSGLYSKHHVLDDEGFCLIGMYPLPPVIRACSAAGLCQAEHS